MGKLTVGSNPTPSARRDEAPNRSPGSGFRRATGTGAQGDRRSGYVGPVDDADAMHLALEQARLASERRAAETGALLGGEFSGHMFFGERWYGFDDGLYSAARLLEILANRSESPSDVLAALPAATWTR